MSESATLGETKCFVCFRQDSASPLLILNIGNSVKCMAANKTGFFSTQAESTEG
jgi:hypothetical protein